MTNITENLVFMQQEDSIVTFERQNGDTIFYHLCFIPFEYKEGDILQAIVHNDNFIEFLNVDIDEMNDRRSHIIFKKENLKKRIKRKL